jgi:hypothetical protein
MDGGMDGKLHFILTSFTICNIYNSGGILPQVENMHLNKNNEIVSKNIFHLFCGVSKSQFINAS